MSERSEDLLRDALRGLDAVPVARVGTVEDVVRTRAARQVRTRRRVAAGAGALALIGALAVVWAVAPGSSPNSQLVVTPAAGPTSEVPTSMPLPPVPPATTAPVTPAPVPVGITTDVPERPTAGTGRIDDPDLAPRSTAPLAVEGRAVLHRQDGRLTIVASDLDGDPTPRHVVTILDGDSVEAAIEVPYPSSRSPFDTTRPIEAGDVTGDGRNDYLIPLESNGPSSLLISADGGTWHRVAGRGLDGTTPVDEFGRDPHIRDGALVVQFNDCDPSCAEGTTTPVQLVYERGVFVWPS